MVHKAVDLQDMSPEDAYITPACSLFLGRFLLHAFGSDVGES